MDELQLNDVWQRTLESLSTSALTAQQRAFVALTRPLGIVGETALIAAPNEFTKDVLETRLAPIVCDALSAVLGSDIRLAVTIDSSIAPDLTDEATDEMADSTYRQLTAASVRLLKDQTLSLGNAEIRGKARLNEKEVSCLSFGDFSLVGNNEIVDRTATIMGGTATIFVRDSDTFVRIATNVKRPDGSRSIGTTLDPAGPAIAAIRQKKSFLGVVDILGKPYFTTYEPITNLGGDLIGIWYAGNPIETLRDLSQKVKKTRILSHGFTAVLDAKNQIMFHSENITSEQCRSLADSFKSDTDKNFVAAAGYHIRRHAYKPWGVTILTATWQSDLNLETFKLAWKFLAFMAVIGAITVFFFLRLTNTINSVAQVMKELSRTGLSLKTTFSCLSYSSQTLSAGAAQQAASVEETGASLEEMSSMIQATADNARRAKLLAAETRQAEAGGAQAMGELEAAMKEIDSSTTQVSKIVKDIDEIAFQTNILALNAAVEAARAGEAGAGFAVVADEVRSLAQRSAAAAKETARKIETAIDSSRKGTHCTMRVGELLEQIARKVAETDALVGEIATAAQEQAQGIEQINQAIGQIDKISQGNASNAEQTAAAAEQVETQGAAINEQVGRLRELVGGDAEAGRTEGLPRPGVAGRSTLFVHAEMDPGQSPRRPKTIKPQIDAAQRKKLASGDSDGERNFRNL